ncbi:MAG: hypothetical protein AAF533_11645 [Acidobacteriota bacterium]
MSFLKSPLASRIGFVVTRIIVPLWILAGALLKLAEHTPKLLPKNIWTKAASAGIDLYWLLAILVALEFLAIGVIWFMPRFSRFMALWMMGCFCLILIAEILAGNDKCGCLGAFSPSPYVMLAIDGTLFLLVLLFKQVLPEDTPWFGKGFWMAAAFTVAGAIACALLILPYGRSPSTGGDGSSSQTQTAPSTQAGGDGASTQQVSGGGSGKPEQPAYLTIDTSDWVGQRFSDIELMKFIDWPADMDLGQRYVVIFSKSCDHCQELLETHFFEAKAAPTVMVAIPENQQGFNEATWIDMAYCTECFEHRDLPVGTDWLITPPLVVAVDNGEVVCAKETDDSIAPECLIFG